MAGHAAAANALRITADMPGEIVLRPLLPWVGNTTSAPHAGCCQIWWDAVCLFMTAPTCLRSRSACFHLRGDGMMGWGAGDGEGSGEGVPPEGGGGGSVLECGQGGDCLIMMHLCKLCRPYGGGDAHGVDHRGVLIPGAAIVAVADPHGLAVSEAGSRGEAHGRGGGSFAF